MAQRFKRPCSYAGCRNLTRSRYCQVHQNQNKKEIDARRGTASRRGYGARWRKARRLYLEAHPLCVKCAAGGRSVAAVVVDHIIPHRGDERLFWLRDNWQALCKDCHDAKTAKEVFSND